MSNWVLAGDMTGVESQLFICLLVPSMDISANTKCQESFMAFSEGWDLRNSRFHTDQLEPTRHLRQHNQKNKQQPSVYEVV